jgi:phage/plasmid-like protein (TIGR03299 family)
MSHNVEKMFSVREVPWHGLGQIVNEAPEAEEAIRLAGLDWSVMERQVFRVPIKDEEGTDSPIRIPDYKILYRSDNKNPLSIMKESYKPLQNKEAFNFFNPFIDSGLASFETAGSLRDGKVVWILATLNKTPIDVGGGDLVNKHLLLSNSHDGTLAVRVGFTPIRVVCNNTLTMSHTNAKSQLLRIRHSNKVQQRLSDIQQIVNAYDAKFEATAEQYKALAKTDVSQKELEKYVNIIFELNPNGTDREQTRAKKMQESIQRLFDNGAGQHLKSAHGTMWGLYNSVTEYLTHEATKDNDQRLYNNWFGGLSKKNEQAFNLAMEYV